MLGEEDLKAKPVEVEVKPEVEVEPHIVVGTDDLTLKKVGEALGEDSYEKYSGELRDIIDFVKREFGAKELNDILWEVRRIKSELGTGYDDSVVKRLYRYVYLRNEKASIDNELRRFNGS